MERDAFLMVDAIIPLMEAAESERERSIGTGLMRLNDRLRLHETMTAFGEPTASRIAEVRAALAAVIRSELTPSAMRAAWQEGNPVGEMPFSKGFLEQIRRKYLQPGKSRVRGGHVNRHGAIHLDEAVALGVVSGAVDEASHLYLRDLCGGSGFEGTIIARGRDAPERTTVECVESVAERRDLHELLRLTVGQASPHLVFRHADIATVDLGRNAGDATINVAKHACGSLTDDLIERSAALDAVCQPLRTAVMTCCHAKARKRMPAGIDGILRRAGYSDPLQFWASIVRAADRIDEQEGANPFLFARFAMRIADALRACAINRQHDDVRAHLHETVPTSFKNHVLVVEKR